MTNVDQVHRPSSIQVMSSRQYSSMPRDEQPHDNPSPPTPDRTARSLPVSLLLRTAMRVSRARWFSFLRRVFDYQNGARSDLLSNPFNTGPWLALELTVIIVQTAIICGTLATAQKERPTWPIRLWVAGYNVGNLLSLPLLCWRYRRLYGGDDGIASGSLPDLERQSGEHGESRTSYLMNKSRTFLELFFALWFVMGNIWVFDARYGAFDRAPKLHMLCIFLLAWNAVLYSFPFLLFVMLCCCVPIISRTLGYNMNMGSAHRGATEDQIAKLPHWKFKETEPGKHLADENSPECCICLAKYRDQEEVRQLPCSHLFHLGCIDQWLRILSCCPLCKHEMER